MRRGREITGVKENEKINEKDRKGKLKGKREKRHENCKGGKS